MSGLLHGICESPVIDRLANEGEIDGIGTLRNELEIRPVDLTATARERIRGPWDIVLCVSRNAVEHGIAFTDDAEIAVIGVPHLALGGELSFDRDERTEIFGEFNYSNVQTESGLEPFALDLNSNIWLTQRGGTGGLDVATAATLREPAG